MNIGIYIYDDAEVLDFSGPFEVFSTASRLSAPAGQFKVFLIAEEARTVNARGGYPVVPHCSIDNHPALDLLIVVGGVHTNELTKPAVIDWVRRTAKNTKLVTSVCTGAFILAQAGLLTGLDVTTHWEDQQALQTTFPDLNVIANQRWVDQGKFVTSGGISAGIDMSLHLVARLASPELAKLTARQMEYEWHTNTHPETYVNQQPC
ncbi:DJ-1/PfpI family protein [Microbulbifer sp. ALW1]|uniref:DJ-1/PfpI family protein n=1 Tax=Microbulbifer sp. (strain ALW1) TaxID=1516059 RepID=UPI0013568EC3|nr:DJ-1/PfpI family protein [Microbulbifer sp. ALW1]